MTKNVVQCRVTDTADAVVLSADHEPDIRFEFPVGGKPKIENHDFAVWALTPIAMLKNVDLKIEGRVSERAIASAQMISDIWEKWRPALFNRVQISADETFSERKNTDRKLSFFSGGMDSTYTAIRALREDGLKTDCLSLHGMDYRYEEQENFDKLMAKTRPFTEAYYDKQHVVKTTLGQVFFRHWYIDEVSHSYSVYLMLACASFYNDYSEYRIASDNRLDTQFWSFPFGNCTATHRLLKSANADLVSMHYDASRSDKARYLHELGHDLNTLAICPDKSIQPQNCGVCDKCIRTKIMFLAVADDVPDVFLDRSIPSGWAKTVNLDDKIKAAYMLDMLSLIENRGDPHSFPGYPEARARYDAQCEKWLSPTLYNTPLKESIRYLTPKPVYDGIVRLKRRFS